MKRPTSRISRRSADPTLSLKSLASLFPPTVYLQIRRLHLKHLKREVFKDLQRQRHGVSPNGYDYSAFDKHQAIFIHIPKCAGVSVSRALFGGLAGGHTTLEQYLDLFTPRQILQYFKFAIVRNPWDRLVSAYVFLKNGGFDDEDRAWADRNLADYDTFEQFVVDWVNPENVAEKVHFRPQRDFIVDRFNNINLNYLGFFENLEHDFTFIANAIGASDVLPRSNVTGHSDYRQYYSDRAIEIVAETYADDIQLLGYSFDNASLPRQIERRNRRYNQA